jgi:hypothetical protein
LEGVVIITDTMVERLARHLSEESVANSRPYTCDDGLRVPAVVEEWTLRLNQARAYLVAAFGEGVGS